MASNGAWTCGQVPRAFVCLSKYLEDFLQVLATVDERHLAAGTSPDKATTHFCEKVRVKEMLLDVDQTLRQKWQILRIPFSSQSQWKQSETDA